MTFFANLQKYRLGQHGRKQYEEQYKENSSESVTNKSIHVWILLI